MYSIIIHTNKVLGDHSAYGGEPGGGDVKAELFQEDCLAQCVLTTESIIDTPK